MEPTECGKKKQWNPYRNHGGSSVGICGKDFVCIGADTRLSSNYDIECRHKPRIFKMSNSIMISCTGFDGDIDAFITRMKINMSQYENQNFQPMSVESVARCVSNTLYSKRFFPYYTNVLVAGINKDGEGKLYGYDPVGTIEDLKYDSNGTGSAFAAPLLDSVFGTVHRNTKPFPDITLNEAKDTIRDAICSVAERDIYTGDTLQIATITAEGFKIEEFPLPEH
jgi:20S proteasome subunit beta 6